MDYFLNVSHWSFPWLIGLAFAYMAYLMLFKTRPFQKLLFLIALLLLYICVGSPVSLLPNFGLHSAVMFQQILILMIVPALVLTSMPETIFSQKLFRGTLFPNKRVNVVLGLWAIGALAMWGGHFLSAAMLSAKTGLAICGIAVPKGSWIGEIPVISFMGLLLVAGLFFSLPVFHPDRSKRIAPLQRVIYLFTACLSCTLLGLYVTFSASSASALAEAVPMFTTLRNPIPLSVRTDQEIAGLLMWVPGCLFYAAASMGVLYQWYTDAEASNTERETATIKIPNMVKRETAVIKIAGMVKTNTKTEIVQ